MDQVEGGRSGGDAARAAYFATRYHQPGDEFSDAWDMRGPVGSPACVGIAPRVSIHADRTIN